MRDLFYVNQIFLIDTLDNSLAEPPLDQSLSVRRRLASVQDVLRQTHVRDVSGNIGGAQSIRMFDVREQLRCLGNACGLEVAGRLEDPKVAVWLLDPGAKEQTLKQMVLNNLPLHSNLMQGGWR